MMPGLTRKQLLMSVTHQCQPLPPISKMYTTLYLKDMAELEKMSVVKSVVSYAKQLHSAELQGNQLTVASLNRALADKTIDGAMLAQAEARATSS
jgi:hypothetical protein